MLTDEEIMDIRNRAKLNDNRQIDPMSFARDIERAVCGGVDFYFDKIPDGETMLYAEPVPMPKQEPFAYCYTDVNGRAKELCESPDCQIPQDKRVITALYKEPQPAQAAAMPEDIELLIAEVKQQFMWRMEDSECGGDEIIESWDKTEFSIRSRLSSASPKPEQAPEPEVFAYDIGYKLESAKDAGYLIYAKDYEPHEDEVIVNKLCIIPKNKTIDKAARGDDECDCEKLQARIRHLERLLMGL